MTEQDKKNNGYSKHLKNIFDSNELVQDSVISILETTAEDGGMFHFGTYH